MNKLMLLVLVLALFVYFGGSMVPSVLKQNKEMLLGGAVGLVLCSFFGMKLEGFDSTSPEEKICTAIECSTDNTVRLPQWQSTYREDRNSFLNRFCNNMGPFPGAGITENRELTADDDAAMSLYHLQDGRFRLSATNNSERSGCGFCQRPEVSGATFPADNILPPPCVNHYDEQYGEGQCAGLIQAGQFTCDPNVDNSFTTGQHAGYCDKQCNVCQGD